MTTNQKHTMISRTKTGPAARVPAILLYLMLSLLVTLTGCEEPIGNQGPQGPQGPQGLEGPEGPIGPAGEDGSMIYAGYGLPSIDIGSPGDYYLNGTTGELYGPKSANGWGGPILILKGEDGQDGQDGADGLDGQDGADGSDGEDGSQIYAGSGPPDAAVGVPGDYYLDRDNYELYGPKTGSGWGPPLNLRGPVGPAGEDGSIMYAGEGAPGDDIGSVGDYYLNQNTGELYGPKAADGWGEPIIVLIGEDGQDGADGQDGQDGADGQDGEDGEDGSQIHAGNGAPDASLGVEGDFYLDKDSYELYGPKTSDGWGSSPINLQRPVIYSEWITSDEWHPEPGFTCQVVTMGTWVRAVTLVAPEATLLESRNAGAIVVYYRVAGRRIFQLPHTINQGGTHTIDFNIGSTYHSVICPGNVQTIIITAFYHDNSEPPSFRSDAEFRYVLIPGGIPAAKMPPGFWNDYEAVAEYYGIPD